MFSTVRASSQFKLKIETQSSDWQAGTTRLQLTMPREGLSPTMLLNAAGTRPEPAVSVPRAKLTDPVATATAEPELDPPLMYFGLNGFRQAPKGDFRSNLHRGGTARAVVASGVEQEVAVRAAGVVGLGVAGVDLIRSKRGPLVLEINSSPGLEGIEAATGVDIARTIIEHAAASPTRPALRKRNRRAA